VPQLFVGTWPPPEVAAVIAEYPKKEITGLRWATPPEWLVNLRPLNDVIAAKIEPLADALRSALDGVAPPTARLDRVFREGWLTVEVDGLEALTATVYESTVPIVPARLNESWHASIVVARGPMTHAMVVPLPAVTWSVTEVVLARTSRSREGPGYTTLETFPLG
jgi:2'-5' RNA ligase